MRTAVLAAAMACVVSAGARAAVETVSGTLGTFDPYYSESDVTLPGFDTTLGTLNSITVSTRASLSETVQVQAASTTAFQGIGAFNAIYEAQIIPTPVSDRSTITQSAPTQLNASGQGTVQASFTDSFTVSAADYAATGPLTIRYDIFAQPEGGLSFSFDGSYDTTAGGTVTVSYLYDAAVPEPASVAVLGMGLLGMLVWRRNALSRHNGDVVAPVADLAAG